jgi:ATP-binding cassette subfamily F protein uup
MKIANCSVCHRFLLDRVSTVVLGLDGQGAAGRFADYSQWDVWQSQRKSRRPQAPSVRAGISGALSATKKKLSYLDAREYETIEQRVAAAEQAVEARRAALEDPTVMRDAVLMHQAYRDFEAAQRAVDSLYARWAELEQKIG